MLVRTTMRLLAQVLVIIVVSFPSARSLQSQTVAAAERDAVVAAIKSVARPDREGKLIVSVATGRSDDGGLSKAVATQLGGEAQIRQQAITCNRQPGNPKGECRVLGGQFVEVHHFKRTETSAEVMVRVVTNETGGRLSRRDYFVTLTKHASGWLAHEVQLVSIS